jgi:serine protease AprX
MCRGLVLCFVGLLILSFSAFAQPQYGFRISFTDKAGTTHSLTNPLGFLSQRAIDRRTAQNIAIDSTDLPVSPAYMDSVLTLSGGKLHITSRWFNYTVLLLNDSSDILTLQGKPFIDTIVYIAYYPLGLHKPGKEIPPVQKKTTGSAIYYGDAWQQTSLVRGDYLHDIGRKGEGKLIAVLDEGFEGVDTGPAFDSLMNSNRLIDQYNYRDAVSNVFMNGLHGTTSLSTMAGNLPGTYVGTAPYADYALYITEIQGSEQVIEMDNIVAASERADSVGADIITISLGYDRFNLPTMFSLTYADIDGKTTIAAKAANMATTKGILFVASAGNEGGGSWNYILTPGDADSAITVGSVGLDKVPAGNSGYGPNSSGRIKPDVCMVGQPASVMRNGPNPMLSSGTSWATPQLAGWAACLMQTSTTLTPYQVRTAIQKSAHVYNNPGVQLGYGVPNFHAALDYLNIKDLPKMPDNGNWLTVNPNPFDEQITIRVYSEQKNTVEIVLTDISGKVVYTISADAANGVRTIQPELPGLTPGVYFLKGTMGDKTITQKLLKR